LVAKKDTIAAIATPPGQGGIGIVRVTGPLVGDISRSITGLNLTPRHAHFCSFLSGDQQAIDQGIAILFKGPSSYTGEDMLELHGHGGRVVLELVLQRLIELGARLAMPGEFTERAFLNGKLDLLQAEAVADLINSTSARAARCAMQSLEGVFSSHVFDLYNNLKNLRVQIESSLDFPEEETGCLDVSVLKSQLQSYIGDVSTMVTKSTHGRRLCEGAYLVIIGRPNVGKSSLLNQLTSRESAIVSDVSGTTRDVISENILIKGTPVIVVDTAGLRETGDALEREGVRRAHAEIGKADFVLLVTEVDEDPEVATQDITGQLPDGAGLIIIRNKIDLVDTEPHIEIGSNNIPEIFLSALTGAGLEYLLKLLSRQILEIENSEDIILARDRHITALNRTRGCLEQCLQHLNGDKNPELLAEELRQAQKALDEITGATTTEFLLGEIFSRFCIGK
jgi:tRNA modification GTPase